MFAYCLNNPVNLMDDSGNLARPARHATIVGGRKLTVVEKIAIEIGIATTEDEQDVIDAEGLIIYKGVPVVKSSFMDDSGFSLGVIVLGNNVTVSSETLLFTSIKFVLIQHDSLS